MICTLLVLSGCGGPRGPQTLPDVDLGPDPTLSIRERCEVQGGIVTCPREVVWEHLHGVISLWDLAMAQARELAAEKALRDVDVAEALAGRARAEGERDRAELRKWVYGAVGVVAGILGGIAIARL